MENLYIIGDYADIKTFTTAEFVSDMNPRETVFTEATHVRSRASETVWNGYSVRR